MSVYRHWSSQRVNLDTSKTYLAERSREFFKPTGLWFDVDSDWRRFCQAECWNVQGLSVAHVLVFKSSANLLKLSTHYDIDAFTDAYLVSGEDRRHSTDAIHWPRLRAEFDGIIIAPYQWSQRMELMWYYTWDCASGCVWNLRTIESFQVEAVGVAS